jgi:ABC-2 type transport system permease protein
LLNLFGMILFREFRHNYPGAWSIAAQIVKLLLMLVGYWFTAKAFAPSFVQFRGAEDYFSFVVIGECVLAIPVAVMAGIAASLKNLSGEGTLDSVLVLPHSHQKTLFLFGLAPALVELCWTSLYLVAAVLIFGLSVPLEGLLSVIFLQIVSLPVFVGLGFLSASILLWLGRGEGVIDAFLRAAVVFAGVFFPVSVMPDFLSRTLLVLSPFNMLLNFSRMAIAEGWSSALLIESSIQFVLIGLILVPIGYYFLGQGFNFHRRRGSSMLVATR